MLIDDDNRFMTQRDFSSLALLRVNINKEGLQVTHKHNKSIFIIPFLPQTNNFFPVEVWSDKCKAQQVSEEADKWFSEMLSFSCRLVFMPDNTRRKVDGRYAFNKEITSFADGYPMLLIGQSSLDDLNSRLKESISINRFRPNIVFTGGKPFEEDILEHFTINNINFYGVKLCARCVTTTINQENAIKGKEPLKTLATYRMHKNKIYFGQNILHHGEGIIKIDDLIEVKKRKNRDELLLKTYN